MLVRDATDADLAAITRIYNHYIRTSIATFMETELTEPEMAGRIAEVRAAGLPWLVTEADGGIAGYAYAGRWKRRSAYRFSTEVTIYLDPERTGNGLGTTLYGELLDRLPACGVHVVIGGISLPNAASVALHERLGFEKVAHFKEVGFKFGQWIDVGYWEKIIAE